VQWTFHPADQTAYCRQFKSTRECYTEKNNNHLNRQDWTPNHQSGFRLVHSTVQQCHLITDVKKT